MTNTTVSTNSIVPADPDTDQSLAEYETDVVEALAFQLECTYSDASGITSLHFDVVEAGYEDRSTVDEIAREIRRLSDSTATSPIQQQQACPALLA